MVLAQRLTSEVNNVASSIGFLIHIFVEIHVPLSRVYHQL